MKVALYTRVSTEDQSVEAQLLELRRYVENKGWSLHSEHTDTMSGGKAERPGLTAMMELVESKAVEAVLCVKLDRMARSLVHFAELARRFGKAGVALICTSQSIDTSDSNPCGRFQQHILAAVAEFERDLIRERTKAGLAVARSRGKVLGRVSAKMPVVAERVPIVQTWRAEGRPGGLDELGARLGGVSRSTAMRVDRGVAA